MCQLIIFFIAKILTLLLIALVQTSKYYNKAEKQIFCIIFADRHVDHGNYAPNSYLPSTCCVVVMLYLPSLFSLLSFLLSLSLSLYFCVSLYCLFFLYHLALTNLKPVSTFGYLVKKATEIDL